MSLNIINYILTPIELICCLIFYAGFCDTSRQLKKKKGYTGLSFLLFFPAVWFIFSSIGYGLKFPVLFCCLFC